MSQGQYNSILSSLRVARSSADYLDTGTVPYSNSRRYVYLDEEALETDYFKRRFTSHPRKPGVYFVQRQNKQPRFYRVLTEQRVPSYSAKFKFFDLSKEQIGRTFQKEFDRMIFCAKFLQGVGSCEVSVYASVLCKGSVYICTGN